MTKTYFICKKTVDSNPMLGEVFTEGECYESKQENSPYIVTDNAEAEHTLSTSDGGAFILNHFKVMNEEFYRDWIKAQYHSGRSIQFIKANGNDTDWWSLGSRGDDNFKDWDEFTYRVKPNKVNPVKIKRSKVEQAYKDGYAIEFKNSNDDWVYIKEPNWMWEVCEYRVNPQSKPAKKFDEIERRKAVEQAFHDGEAVQFFSHFTNTWETKNPKVCSSFNWVNYKYRIHPEGITILDLLARDKVEQAFENGAEIQFKLIGSDTWFGASTPQWEWTGCVYRIKETWTYTNMEGDVFKEGDSCYFFNNAGKMLQRRVTPGTTTTTALYNWSKTEKKALRVAANTVRALKNDLIAQEANIDRYFRLYC